MLRALQVRGYLTCRSTLALAELFAQVLNMHAREIFKPWCKLMLMVNIPLTK
jgi:hypothetical protein